jgi:hypothetical protein
MLILLLLSLVVTVMGSDPVTSYLTRVKQGGACGTANQPFVGYTFDMIDGLTSVAYDSSSVQIRNKAGDVLASGRYTSPNSGENMTSVSSNFIGSIVSQNGRWETQVCTCDAVSVMDTSSSFSAGSVSMVCLCDSNYDTTSLKFVCTAEYAYSVNR